MKRCDVPLVRRGLEPRLAETRLIIVYACLLQVLSICAGMLLARLLQ